MILSICSCNLLKKQKDESIKSEFTFDKVSFYADYKTIMESTSDPQNAFFSDSLLSRFQSSNPNFNNSESVALLFGGLSHEGYQDKRIPKLESEIDSLSNLKQHDNVLAKAEECLSIFPLNVKMLMEKWIIYNDKKQLDSAALYGKRLNILFTGMQRSGYGQDENRPQLALSKSSIDYYCNFHAAGAELKLQSEEKDKSGNIIVVYASPIIIERFIIPVKK